MISTKIAEMCEKLGIYLPDNAALKMQEYWHNVLETNKVLNLTRILDEDEACYLHFVDSLAPLLFEKDIFPPGARVLDIGTGAGFPGVPLAAARPQLDMTLIDARRKRVDFVKGALSRVGIKARVEHKRAEDVRECFDVVLVRAVASIEKLCEITLPLLAHGGKGILWKGPGVFEELAVAEEKIIRLGGCILPPKSYELPVIDRKHWLVQMLKDDIRKMRG